MDSHGPVHPAARTLSQHELAQREPLYIGPACACAAIVLFLMFERTYEENKYATILNYRFRHCRERVRLDKTKEELYKMQVDLDQGRFDNGLLNDVIDSLRKSSNDDRLSTRDKEIIADDLVRLKDFQNNHNRWPHQ